MEEETAGSKTTTLVAVAGGNFVQLGSRFLVGAVVPLLLVQFETTRTTIGLALTGMWAIYALTQFPSGVLAERYGERLVVIVSLTAVCGGILVVALAPSIRLFTGAVLVLVGTVLTVPRLEPSNSDRNIRELVNVRRHWSLLARPRIAYSVVLGAMVAFTFQAISSFFPTFLVEFRGLGTDLAGVAFGVVFALSALAQPVAGRFSDRYSRDVALGASISVALAGVLVLLVVPGVVGLITGVVLLGLGISWPGPIQARFFDLLSETERGYGYGLIRSVYMLLASASSVIVGFLVDRSGWVTGFGCLVVVLFACLVLIGINRQFDIGL